MDSHFQTEAILIKQETEDMEQDSKAISLLRDFVKEKLGGDIHKLRTYDFSSLDDDRKYGSTYHTRAPIVKAVMSVAFCDVWPELSMDKIDHGPYECAVVQTYQNLFGINMCDQYFKGMQYFKPSASQFQRALKVAHLTCSVGNLWVLPGNGTISNRILDNSYRYYMDKFLKNIHGVLTQQKRVDKILQKAIDDSPQMKQYYGEDGFQKFVHDMMLEDYVDYYGKPMDIFDFVWSSQRGLDRDKYFNAVDEYCSFCEKAFMKRADKTIEKLDAILSNTQILQKPEIPIVVSERPKPGRNESQETSNILNRYALAYQFIPMSIDFAKDDIDVRLPLLAEKDYHVRLSQKLELKIEGFAWEEFTVSVEKFDNLSMIFYAFPKPQREPEAKYGALLFDHNNDKLAYYTLEMCSHSDRWALGVNTADTHTLIGMYDMEPTKENFIKLIVPKDKLLPEIDIKSLLNLPLEYKVLDKFPEDPMYSVNYGMNTSNCASFVQSFPMSARRTMDYYNVQKIINGIHQSLDDSQALIEVKAGRTNHNRQYVYSIVKTKGDPIGVQYFMLMHVAYEDIAINVNGHFVETGMTGERDSIVWELACRKGFVSISDNSKWTFDPYDKNLKRPYLMNLSEKEEFDKMFPDHPLSQCRRFVEIVTQKL